MLTPYLSNRNVYHAGVQWIIHYQTDICCSFHMIKLNTQIASIITFCIRPCYAANKLYRIFKKSKKVPL